MTQISTTAVLSYPYIPKGSFIGRAVSLEEAAVGDVVEVFETIEAPAGVSFFAYVQDPGVVRVCARNRTDDVIAVPADRYDVLLRAPVLAVPLPIDCNA